ncbi:SHOCT domain-containing protein [Streptomyces sp. NBC_00199]|uniref:SHOCT domain-containing protein n=1 Tax=Streptomyces sp. NBC_00199 TaxID=2975678 RepID=UPI0022532636|nr:SHOCT domain-containing protein [Streptomyces sp. NBC_00199]MCX5267952.1 SHOCT domain-containing protein [Streptomyces sp. NBC_00199]
MSSSALMTFKSHIEGKNADVAIHHDRVEWARGRGMSAKKLTAGLLTGGASLLATGVRGSDAGTEMIPVRNISSVVTKRDGLMYTKVVVVASGNTIEFRVPHDAAPGIKALLTDLVLGKIPAPGQAAPAVAAPARAEAPAPQADSPVEQLRQLAGLRDAGILSEEEFTAKKAEILARM